MRGRWMMMARWGVAASITAAAVAFPAGCDRSSNSLPAPAASTQPASASTRPPTTQELLSGPRKQTALTPFPLTMELPPGWGPMAEAPAPHLWDGPTPNGRVQFQVSARHDINRKSLDQLMADASKEMSLHPNHVIKVELRPHGEDKILERQTVGQPSRVTLYDNNNVPHTSTESIFNWTISLLIPDGDVDHVYEINFIGLTQSQYEKDRDFLNKILTTLEYSGPASAPATTAP